MNEKMFLSWRVTFDKDDLHCRNIQLLKVPLIKREGNKYI